MRQGSEKKSPIAHYEIILFIAMFLLTAVYLYTQFTRPNLTLEAEEIGLRGYLSHVDVGEMSHFLRDSLAHFTLALGLLNLTGGAVTIISIVTVNLILLAYFYGGSIVQIGLTWMMVHLTFIYFALWTQKPELFAGRHIYQAGLGLVWAIGVAVDWWQGRWVKGEIGLGEIAARLKMEKESL